jgi:hypothetical protein
MLITLKSVDNSQIMPVDKYRDETTRIKTMAYDKKSYQLCLHNYLLCDKVDSHPVDSGAKSGHRGVKWDHTS